MKSLTHIHLLMERVDLLFVASELVKYYGLKSKVKFGTYGKDEGGYNWDTDTIYLNKYYKKVSEFIITVLHEIHHAKQINKMGRRKFMKKYQHLLTWLIQMVKIDIGQISGKEKLRIGLNKNIVKNGKINSNFFKSIAYILLTIVMNSLKVLRKIQPYFSLIKVRIDK